MLTFAKSRKKDKARAVALKTIGTLVLLLAFLCQHFLVERWREHLGIVRQLRTDSIQFQQSFSDAKIHWLQLQIHSAEATPLSLELALTKLGDSAEDIVSAFYLSCTLVHDLCRGQEKILLGPMSRSLPQDATAEFIIERMMPIMPAYKRLHERLWEYTTQLEGVHRRLLWVFYSAYLIGSFALISGLIFELRGVDE